MVRSDFVVQAPAIPSPDSALPGSLPCAASAAATVAGPSGQATHTHTAFFREHWQIRFWAGLTPGRAGGEAYPWGGEPRGAIPHEKETRHD